MVVQKKRNKSTKKPSSKQEEEEEEEKREAYSTQDFIKKEKVRIKMNKRKKQNDVPSQDTVSLMLLDLLLHPCLAQKKEKEKAKQERWMKKKRNRGKP